MFSNVQNTDSIFNINLLQPLSDQAFLLDDPFERNQRKNTVSNEWGQENGGKLRTSALEMIVVRVQLSLPKGVVVCSVCQDSGDLLSGK